MPSENWTFPCGSENCQPELFVLSSFLTARGRGGSSLERGSVSFPERPYKGIT
jgi:hypothetical protein